MERSSDGRPPVAIGGIGGSGTRLVAEIVRRLGFYLGRDLNVAVDNLWFTLLFKRFELGAETHRSPEFDCAAEVFRRVMVGDARLTAEQIAWVRTLAVTDRLHHDGAWLAERVETLLEADAAGSGAPDRWGWKEPNTHVFLDRLPAAFPGMKYIHVARNGLDMAFSANQNQLQLWGRLFLGEAAADATPRASLKYWCHVHRRVLRFGAGLPGHFLMLNYGAFCQAPREHLPVLGRFLGVSIDPAQQAVLESLVRVPDSIGRFKAHSLDLFDPADVRYVQEVL
jgi:hypothetical protein